MANQAHMNSTYLDYASTTPVHPEVLEAMIPYFSEQFGNANSGHSYGLEAKKALDRSRATVAEILNCEPGEVIFTSGGTQSNNLAIFGLAKAHQEKGKNILSSTIEHSSVHTPLQVLQEEGYTTTWISPKPDGLLEISAIEKAITPTTTFASFIYANNEIGVVQNIPEIAELLKEKGIIFHSDACQAAGHEEIDTKKLGLDLMTLNGSKVYGPKGVGLLYVKKGIAIKPLIYGGGQEFGIHSGTTNTPGIVGLAKALEIATTRREAESARLKALRDYMINEFFAHIPGSKLNGHPVSRLANNVNIMLPHLNAREMILHLDNAGICISSGSACATGQETPSHVLKAIGLTDDEAKSTLRITLGSRTTPEQIQKALDTIIKISKKIK